MSRRRLALVVAVALVLGCWLVPRPETDVSAPERVSPAPTPARWRAPARPSLPVPNADEVVAHSTEEAVLARIVGQVLDDRGLPVAGAVVYTTSSSGASARVADDEGLFSVISKPGAVTLEAGFYDGADEWRSRPIELDLRAGEVGDVALEILLGGAGHAVHAEVREAMGVGWVVGADDGPLLEGDVLVEVDGLLLTDLQPEAVQAALRERPGEPVEALVLREAPDGHLDEVAVQLVAR